MKERYQEIARLREQASFLGYEFLSWLFLLLDRDDAKEEIAAIVAGITTGHCSVVLGNRMVTCLLHHKEQKTSVVSPLLEESHEVFASLRNGHVIEALALAFLIDETKITLTLHAQDFAISQTKITANFTSEQSGDDNLAEDDQQREDVFLRMNTLADVEEIIDRLYRTFLALRVDYHSYGSSLAAMREQVADRLSNYLHKGHVAARPTVLSMGST
jgi:hypothetical protein